ncbi:MAG: hypothetical protein GXY83_43110 [Rhodopirellula sp.]|nr:hypothetical protein [Rhodopirellula sp.]
MTFAPELLRTAAALLGRMVMLAAVAASPWWFGGVQPSFQVWLFAAVGVALLCVIVEKIGTAGAFRVPSAATPLIGALVLGGVQLLPMPAATLRIVAPHTAALRNDLTSQSMPEGDGQLRTISLCPAATRQDLALLTLATGAFLAGLYLFQTSAARMWLCGVLAVNGAALAVFAIVQMRHWNGMLYWHIPLRYGGAPFGPYVCRNNAAGYLCLCLAGAVGLVVWRFSKAAALSGPRQGRTVDRLLQRIWAWAGLANILALALAGCIVAGIVCSLSRGGWLAMAGGAAGTGIVLCVVRRQLAWLLPFVALPVIGLALVLWMGLDERVPSRMLTFLDWPTLSQNRTHHWRESIRAVPDFWSAGSGLGTYRYVYKPYETKRAAVWFHHAENQYLEALIVGGVVGLGLLLAAIVMVANSIRRLLRGQQPATFAFGVAGTLALATQVIHGGLDFGLYLPANMLAFALICGALCSGRIQEGSGVFFRIGRRRRPIRKKTPDPLVRRLSPKLVSAALLLGFMTAFVWGGVQTQRSAVREAALDAVPEDVEPANASAAEAEIRRGLDRLQRAIAVCSDDVDLHLAAARLWTARYRLALLATLDSPASQEVSPQSLWDRTAPEHLRAAAHRLAARGLTHELDTLRQQPPVREYLTPAFGHLLAARAACPLSAKVHLRIAELAFLVEDPRCDTVHIRRACRLAPAEPNLWLRVGLLDLQAGRIDAAWSQWRKGLMVGTEHLKTILALAESHAGPMEIAERLLPDSAPLLVRVGQGEYSGLVYLPVREVLGRRIESILPAAELDEAEKRYYSGIARAWQHDVAGSVANLNYAVALRPAEPQWRYALAVQLRKAGNLSEAYCEAQVAARLDPSSGTYRRLLEEIERALSSGVQPR